MMTNDRTSPVAMAQKPISVILTSTGNDRVEPGERFELGVTVSNQGNQDAIIDLLIDERDPALRQWSKALQKRLALGPNQSGEVLFQFSVPADTLPGTYNYDLIVDAREAYPEFPPQRFNNRQFQVVLPDRGTTQINDPTLVLEPRTSPASPLVIPVGGLAAFQVWLENRSERVDRFRLVCTGLPPSWQTKIIYPTLTTGVGLIIEADSLGLNPGDRASMPIQVQIIAPPDAPAGPYTPTLRLYSENYPELGLLDLVYLQVTPVYLVQPQLQALQSTVRDRRPARFQVELANLGNTDRRVQVQVRSLEEEGTCRYKLEPSEVTVHPQGVAQLLVEGKPLNWWRRPWFGAGKLYNFEVALADLEQHPLTPPTLSGYMTWAPRPWWQLLLAAIAALGTLGALIWLVWWLFFRPPVMPQLLEFAAEDSQYAVANQDIARVRWQIDRPDRLQTLKISGLSPEGKLISGPLVFDFGKGLPSALQGFCTQQERLLNCSSVRTDARLPGQYLFELSLTPKGRRTTPITKRSQLVTIDPRPQPVVQEFAPVALAYRERGDTTPNPDIPVVTPNGVSLNWIVSHPQELDALKLVGRDGKGAVIGQLWFEFKDENGDGRLDVPQALRRNCWITTVLKCQNIPTGLTQVGDYQFDLTPIARETPTEPPKPKASELVKIQPRAAYIAGFRVNGEEALPKYRVPLSPGLPAPVVLLSWDVQGGSTTSVELQPSPGSVPLQSQMTIPLNQQYGSMTIALQVKDATGKATTRSVTFETFDPNPIDPIAVSAAAAAASARAASEVNAAALRAAAQMNRPVLVAPAAPKPPAAPNVPAAPLLPPTPPALPNLSPAAPAAAPPEMSSPGAVGVPGTAGPAEVPGTESDRLAPTESLPKLQ